MSQCDPIFYLKVERGLYYITYILRSSNFALFMYPKGFLMDESHTESKCDAAFVLRINIGHSDLYFMV